MCFDAVSDSAPFLIFERLESDLEVREDAVANQFEGFVPGFSL